MPSSHPCHPLPPRSTARLSSGQRTALNDVESVAAVDREGSTYWVYEHISQVKWGGGGEGEGGTWGRGCAGVVGVAVGTTGVYKGAS
jgi:hypothetical protein